MKAHLMFPERDFDPGRPPPPQAEALTHDLGLDVLVKAMAGDDKHLATVARAAVLAAAAPGRDRRIDLATIGHRQAVLRDCLARPEVVRALHALAVETLEAVRKSGIGGTLRYPGWVLGSSVAAMQMLMEMARRLRKIAERHGAAFHSEGFTRMFAMLRRELDDEYFALVSAHLAQLKFRRGVVLSAALGEGGKACDHVLRPPPTHGGGWWHRLFTPSEPGYSFELAPRDDNGARALSELRDRGINLVANALAQSADHVASFFAMLRTELAFYVGCLNLHDRLSALGQPCCFPEAEPARRRVLSAAGLYDPCLALATGKQVVGNDLAADGRDLLFITGANQGGKSTFLRALGVAQLMLQCGMFAPAQSLRAGLCAGVFTHGKREEDTAMKSGKFDEEMRRMSEIADHLGPDALVLFNESFAATNEREGSEVAREVILALRARAVRVCFVTHQYQLSHGFAEQGEQSVLFLRAERGAEGARPFRISEGAPLSTSYGRDLYERVFADDAAGAPERAGAAD